ncbi:hypothetical protein V466_14430 [Pseudomonas mandelii PD30]|uniref:Uncharacterized protein n=1 Tax=Pseudomonas mandelii PD30 TaxID=1419583 RepID=A0A059L2Q1_9PSED|nr:hypothetical protein V466_14430 [Pseudomonas mandelii PD30]
MNDDAVYLKNRVIFIASRLAPQRARQMLFSA